MVRHLALNEATVGSNPTTPASPVRSFLAKEGPVFMLSRDRGATPLLMRVYGFFARCKNIPKNSLITPRFELFHKLLRKDQNSACN